MCDGVKQPKCAVLDLWLDKEERKKKEERCMDGVANQGVYVRTKVNAEQSQGKSQCEQ